jgi:hypothetical protein
MQIHSHNSNLISPSVILRSNPSIDVKKKNHTTTRSCNQETNKKRRPSPGRHVKLEPVMILTPVMTSKRTAGSTPDKPPYHPDDINDVCDMLKNLFLDKEEQRNDNNQKSNITASKQIKGEETTFSQYGRVATAVQDPRKKEFVTEFRSPRLASNETH